ncbi:unnamed protein product [Cuscuta europaea]|uniref:Uncharacterized protein n=1 Tax=Cuscuta europaea TaxID=41803 RepID=A0A9P1A0S5_CUSEU|nr:unnamed protein product [Cuscuta europaea]
MEGTSNEMMAEFHKQLEAMKEEIRCEMAQQITFIQRENDVLRSQVQSVASIASNSRFSRRGDAMTAATRIVFRRICSIWMVWEELFMLAGHVNSLQSPSRHVYEKSLYLFDSNLSGSQ